MSCCSHWYRCHAAAIVSATECKLMRVGILEGVVRGFMLSWSLVLQSSYAEGNDREVHGASKEDNDH